MVSELPPLGSRGMTPADHSTLPVLPDGLSWALSYAGTFPPPPDKVEMQCAGARVAIVCPLATGEGWLAQVGCHRDNLEGRHSIWTRTFDRGIDYVVAWGRQYASAIQAEATAAVEARLASNPYRIKHDPRTAPAPIQPPQDP